MPKYKFPQSGTDFSSILRELEEFKSGDINWKKGKNFAYTYFSSEELIEIGQKAYNLFYGENALNPAAFPSLRKMENRIVAMCVDLFHGDEAVCGCLTTGGTESLLMAVKSAREWAKAHRKINGKINIVLANSAHPAFHKAAHYFDIECRIIPVNNAFEADLNAIKEAIDPNTVMLIASAPSYPHGVMDPVKGIAALAREHGLLCHVDACIGGMMLPFFRDLGENIPAFDFEIDGVSSLSADLHKYGYTAKGASVLLYKNKELRKFQFYSYTEWPGGIYASPSMTGTRSGAIIAAAYAVMIYLGRKGYLREAARCLEARNKLIDGIAQVKELELVGKPCASLLAIRSDQIDIHHLADEMSLLGWYLDRQQYPDSLHITLSPVHQMVIEDFIEDIKKACNKCQRLQIGRLKEEAQLGVLHGLKKVLPDSGFNRLRKLSRKFSQSGSSRKTAMYGAMALFRETGDLKAAIEDYLSDLDELV